MQLRILSEMIQCGMHASYTDPPKNSMFQRAGGKDTPKGKLESVAEITAHVASQAVASTLTPKASCYVGTSPGRVIENCSKCYCQLSELNNLKSSGVLSLEENEADKKSSDEIIEDSTSVNYMYRVPSLYTHKMLHMLCNHVQNGIVSKSLGSLNT